MGVFENIDQLFYTASMEDDKLNLRKAYLLYMRGSLFLGIVLQKYEGNFREETEKRYCHYINRTNELRELLSSTEGENQ